MGNSDSRGRKTKDKISFDLATSALDYDPAEFSKDLEANLSRLIMYAEVAETPEQMRIAERLANEAVDPARQAQISRLGGLELAFTLARSSDIEVRRLAVHTIANLSVDKNNQSQIVSKGGLDILIPILCDTKENEAVVRQATKAVANLAVKPEHKTKIFDRNGLQPLFRLATSASIEARIEAVAAIANLAVDNTLEVEIARMGGIEVVTDILRENTNTELQRQACRAIRNLSVSVRNARELVANDVENVVHKVLDNSSDPTCQRQLEKCLLNLQKYS